MGSDDRNGTERRPPKQLPAPSETPRQIEEPGLYFFPESRVTRADLERLLAEGSREERCWAISHLLRFAQWDDIWIYVTRDEVRELFAEIELPDKLRSAWARMLKIETPVGG